MNDLDLENMAHKLRSELNTQANKIANTEFIKKRDFIIDTIESILLENGVELEKSIVDRLETMGSKKGRPTKKRVLYVSLKNDTSDNINESD